jgi:hypothetical protein
MKLIYILYAIIAPDQPLAVPVQMYQTPSECIVAAANITDEQLAAAQKSAIQLGKAIYLPTFTCVPQREFGFNKNLYPGQ